jgi:hypothetical protein
MRTGMSQMALALVTFAAAGHRVLAQGATAPNAAPSLWQYSGFVDTWYLGDTNDPANHLFRNRGTTPRVGELDLNMIGLGVKKSTFEGSRWGTEVTVQAGRDSEIFGFSPTARNVEGANWLRRLGPTNVSYLAPVGSGLTVQGGIFSSLIGYDSLYAKDNFNYTRPWGADYTPYLMLGVNASYAISKMVAATAFVVNGYWHLAHANDVPSIGGQIAYKANDRMTVKETVLVGPHQSNTSLEFWRYLSDAIVERRSDRVTAAFEYQLATENVDVAGRPRAPWMSAQLPLHWAVRGPWSVMVRPEFAWDRDGRWIDGASQSVKAVTTTLEYRVPYRRTQTILRLEHRYDDSRGSGGGFFDAGDQSPGVPRLTPTQHLLIVTLIVSIS